MCKFEGCEKPVRSNGYCIGHYRQLMRGTPMKPLRNRSPNGYDIRINDYGYATVLVKGIRVHEHRVVMEGILGRPLFPGENVHHINGVRNDNRPENLELWVSNQPSGQRVEDLVAWAHQILDRYEVSPPRTGAPA